MMKQLAVLLKIEGKLSLRCPDGIIFGIAMPVAVMLLIGCIAKDQFTPAASYTYLESAFPALVTVGICATAFMGLPLTFADYRDKKILKHFFVTPVSPWKMLLALGILNMITALVSAALITLCAITIFDYQMAGNPFLFLGAFGFVLFAMYGIGMIIASLCPSVRIANIVTTLVYFPMLFLSGATIPFELFPDFLQTIANVLPLTLGIKLLKSISLNQIQAEDGWIVMILLLLAVVGWIISLKTFRWE